jgi:hypothetical protein
VHALLQRIPLGVDPRKRVALLAETLGGVWRLLGGERREGQEEQEERSGDERRVRGDLARSDE